jgi:hypothetical protein
VALVASRQFTAAPRAQGAGTIWDGIYTAAPP